MLVIDLIKELEKLPNNATIGTININETKIINDVPIKTNQEMLYDQNHDRIKIERIEQMRTSNKDKICDFYIV